MQMMNKIKEKGMKILIDNYYPIKLNNNNRLINFIE